jgi:hypothetical protein
VPDWKDFAAVFCAVLAVVSAAALGVASQTFAIVHGKVLEKGVATVDPGDGKPYTVSTVSVLLQNDDRVFQIKRGTVAKYAISEGDSPHIDIGSNVELMITSHDPLARVIQIKAQIHSRSCRSWI